MNRIEIIGVRPVSDAEIRATYYDNHRVCPKCFCRPAAVTTVGIVQCGHDFKDDNKASCNCGWVGLVDDLLPQPPETKAEEIKRLKEEADQYGWTG